MDANLFIYKLKHLSMPEKVVGAGVVLLAGYLVYSHYKSSASAATLPPGAGMPSNLPAPAPVTPVAYAGPIRTGGPLGYTVQTQTDNLMVRSGPSTNFAVIGQFVKGSTVIATGRLADGSGMTWAEVKTPDGKLGWSSTSYLTPTA